MWDEIIMKTKNKLLITLSVFLILFVLIGSVSAVDDNTATLKPGFQFNIKIKR